VALDAVRKSGFTPRQAEIIDLIASGMADKEIAKHLGVSVSTIRTHLQRLYKGIGARNRAQAVAEYLDTSGGGGSPGYGRRGAVRESSVSTQLRSTAAG